MTTRKILLPYNHTPQDRKALNFVIETFRERGEVRITLFNTYAPLPEIEMASSPELGKLRGGLAALQEEFRERESGLKATRDFILQNGFHPEQVDYVLMKREQSIPDDILDTAHRGHYDVIVLSGRERESRRVARMLSRSVHERVLRAATGVTVCIAK